MAPTTTRLCGLHNSSGELRRGFSTEVFPDACAYAREGGIVESFWAPAEMPKVKTDDGAHVAVSQKINAVAMSPS